MMTERFVTRQSLSVLNIFNFRAVISGHSTAMTASQLTGHLWSYNLVKPAVKIISNDVFANVLELQACYCTFS